MNSRVPQALRLFLITGLALNFLCLLCAVLAHFVWHLQGLYMSQPANHFAADLLIYLPLAGHFRTPEFFHVLPYPLYRYPAPIAPLYLIFLTVPHPARVIGTLIAVVFSAMAYVFARTAMPRLEVIPSKLLLVLLLLAAIYPAWFELRQGNMEIFTFVLLSTAVWAFLTGHDKTAAICIGVAGAMKLYPLFYLGLFIAARRPKFIIYAFATSAFVTIASLWFLSPNLPFAWREISRGLDDYRVTVVLPTIPLAIGWDHSLFTLWKLGVRIFAFHTMHMPQILSIYIACTAVAGMSLFFLRIRFLPVLNQVLCLTLACTLLPPSSFDYTLINLYVPLALLVLFAFQRGVRNEPTPGLKAAFLCFAVAMASETELIYHQRGYGGQIKAIFLLALFFIALRYPFGATSTHRVPPVDDSDLVLTAV